LGVKFLTEEWADQVKSALNASEGFQRAAGSQIAKIQQVITGTPEGDEKRFWFKVEGGQADLGLGDIEGPDATIAQDYDTAVALFKNELTPTAAYMSGKLRVQGDLMKLMQLQGPLGQIPQALNTVDVEY
jgi:putative sterol carrier protein